MTADDEEIASDGLEEYANEKFYRGVLQHIQRGRRCGVIRSSRDGREIAFDFTHTVLLGDRLRWEDVHEGQEVGFDVGWTSSGLRVTAIRPLD